MYKKSSSLALDFNSNTGSELALEQCLQNNVQHKPHTQTDKIKYEKRKDIFSDI